MANFEPTTTIYLCQTGIDDYNKPYFESNAAMAAWIQGKLKMSFTEYSYQRGDERQYCAVGASYALCIDCDTILYRNDAGMWIVGNITGCEFKNPNTTWVYFEIDAFCTFCGNISWQDSYSLVEREHIATDWNGSVPNWGELGVAEPMNAEPRVITGATLESDFGQNTFVCMSPYNEAGNPNVQAINRYGIFEGLAQINSTSASAIANYLNTLLESSRGSAQDVLGIWSVPAKAVADTMSETAIGSLMCPWGENIYNLNNAKCFSGQYCTLNIETICGDSKSYSPELLENTVSIDIRGKACFVNGSGGLTCYPSMYAGRNGEFFAATINEFPQGAWVSDTYAEWLTSSTLSILGRYFSGAFGGSMLRGAQIGAAGGGAGMALGAALGAVGGAVNASYGIMADAQQRMKGAATVNGTATNATVSYAMASGLFNFQCRFYMPTENELKSIDSFFDMYGYKVMRLKVPERNTRPCWNYVKCASGHVHCNAPITYVRAIEHMLETGVTFWNVSARDIGDYSNPQANKA